MDDGILRFAQNDKESEYPFEGIRLCPFCRRRPAARQCDAPVGRIHWVGHPPRCSSPGGVAPWETPMHVTVICDRPICEVCATRIAADIDYCPDCMKRFQRKE